MFRLWSVMVWRVAEVAVLWVRVILNIGVWLYERLRSE